MEKIFITTQAGQKVEVGVVRLFKHNDTVFFIYTLSEKDANNYIKLYVTKINMSSLQSVVISEESEWVSFKEIMKTIIKNNRNNAPLEISDIDPKTIQNITVYDPKVFKLSEEMTNFLQMNTGVVTEVSQANVEESKNTVSEVFAPSAPTNSEEITSVGANADDKNLLSGDISSIPEPADVINKNEDSTEEVPNITLPEVEPVESNEQINNSIENENLISLPGDEKTTNDVPAESEIDYRVAYLEEQLKVETLNTKIATLEAQIKMLEQKIEQIKNVIK